MSAFESAVFVPWSQVGRLYFSVLSSLYLTLNATISGKDGKNCSCCFIMKSWNN